MCVLLRAERVCGSVALPKPNEGAAPEPRDLAGFGRVPDAFVGGPAKQRIDFVGQRLACQAASVHIIDMATDFDPYRKWLGIPPQYQPPNHYRLLGIELFEADADVIANAADQRAIHLKTFATGPYAPFSQRLLNEVAAARVCLLNPAEKAKYDSQLRAQLAAEAASQVVVEAAAPADGVSSSRIGKPKALPATPKIAAAFDSAPTSATDTGAGGNRADNVNTAAAVVSPAAPFDWRGNLPVLVAGALALVVSVVAITVAVVLMSNRQSGDSNASPVAMGNGGNVGDEAGGERPPDDAAATGKTTESGEKLGDGASGSGNPDVNVGSGADEPKSGEGEAGEPGTPNVNEPSAPGAMTDRPSPGGGETPAASPDKPADPSDANKTPGEGASAQPSKPSEGSGRPSSSGDMPEPPGESKPTEQKPSEEKPSLPPAPSAEYVAKTEEEIRRLFKDEIQKSKAEDRLQLIRKLEALADESKKDHDQQFAILHTATNLAAEAEMLDVAMSILGRMESAFDFNALDRKAALLAKFNGPSVKMTPLLNAKLLSMSQAVLDEARQSGEGAAALVAADVATKAALRAKDGKLRSALDKLMPELDQLKRQQDLAVKAFERLKIDPDNPKANTVAGMWNCLMRGRWDEGLKQLLKSEDQALASLAARDLAGDDDPQALIALGDGWWEWSRHSKGLEQHRLKGRAVHWYGKALDKLSGLELARFKSQLDEKGLIYKPYALKFNGKNSVVVIEPFRYDGSYPITVEAIVQLPPEGESTAERARQIVVGNVCDRQTGFGLYIHGRYGYFEVACGANNASAYGSLGFEPPLPPRRRPHDIVPRGRAAASPVADPDAPSPSEGVWRHLAGVFTGTGINLFIDGQLVGSDRASGGHKPSIVPVLIGAGHHQPQSSSAATVPTNFFAGLIRGVRISSGQRYRAHFKPPAEFSTDSSTLVLFNFAEGKGAKLLDASGNKNVGTVIAAEWVPLPSELRLPPLTH